MIRTVGTLLILICFLLVSACGTPRPAPVVSLGGGGASSYTVQRGDTLYSISWRHGVDFRSVARWNHIEPPYLIYPGQRLRLEPSATTHSARQHAPAARAPSTAARPPARAPASPAARSPAPAPQSARVAWRWPTDGKLLKPFDGGANGKQGIEIAGAAGQPVVAAAAGRVVYSGNGLRGYGNLVIIKHNVRYLTAYGYNRTLLVKEGELVGAGQKIAEMGANSARTPALHFELREDGKAVDPLRYLGQR